MPTDYDVLLAEAENNNKRVRSTNGKTAHYAGTDKNLRVYQQCLDGLGADADDYHLWLQAGMIGATLGQQALKIWVSWSSQSEKYKSGECEIKWRGFDGNGALRLGTLIKRARDAGVSLPARERPQPALSTTADPLAAPEPIDDDRPWPDAAEHGDDAPEPPVSSGNHAALASIPASEPADTNEEWPAPLHADALHGLAGDVVRAIEPYSEADPAALLIQFHVAFGNCIGRGRHWRVGGDEHHGNLYAVLVGKTAKGRKGTSLGEICRIFKGVDSHWHDDRKKSGLSSAEGLIWAVRDPTFRCNPETGEDEIVEDGIKDKRLLLIEPEFAQTLKQTERAGNTLSPVIRQAWERGNLETLTKNNPTKSTGAHISIIGHITQGELLRYLTSTESGNGFANRFVWCCVRRSKLLPDGGSVPDATISGLQTALISAVEKARGAGRLISRDAAAADLWRSVYGELTAERDGLAAAVCGRAEAQTMRLAMLYALLDGAAHIGVDHLRAGLAVWRYCENSATYIFGNSLGDPVADEIGEALRRRPEGMTRNEIRDLFGRNRPSAEIARALGVLSRAGQARPLSIQTAGRPAEIWFWTG